MKVETYISVNEATDYAIKVLKYFASASSMMLAGIVGIVAAWIFENPIGMTVAIIGTVLGSNLVTIGLYKLHIRKKKRR
nr:MAG TPA: Cell-membrane associated Mucin15 [Caudoviricetes sp.]